MARVVTVEQHPRRDLYGLWVDSTERQSSLDGNVLAHRYEKVTGSSPGEQLPFFVVTSGRHHDGEDLRLFAGAATFHPDLERCILPAGRYARVTVRPFLGWLWGPAVTGALRHLYRTWLPAAGEQPGGLDFEMHTAATRGWWPSMVVEVLLADGA